VLHDVTKKQVFSSLRLFLQRQDERKTTCYIFSKKKLNIHKLFTYPRFEIHKMFTYFN